LLNLGFGAGVACFLAARRQQSGTAGIALFVWLIANLPAIGYNLSIRGSTCNAGF
jgi:hypothetical protein